MSFYTINFDKFETLHNDLIILPLLVEAVSITSNFGFLSSQQDFKLKVWFYIYAFDDFFNNFWVVCRHCHNNRSSNIYITDFQVSAFKLQSFGKKNIETTDSWSVIKDLHPNNHVHLYIPQNIIRTDTLCYSTRNVILTRASPFSADSIEKLAKNYMNNPLKSKQVLHI